MRVTRMLLVAASSLGAVLCGFAWSMSSPVGSTPDENYHLASIWCAAGESPTCAPAPQDDLGRRQVRVPGLVAEATCFAYRSDVSGECQEDIRGTAATSKVDGGDYPPLFYRVMHVFVGDRIGESVLAMRFFNVLLAAGLLSALVVVGTPATRRLIVYATVAAGVPLGWFLLASINPTGWTLTGVTAYAFGLHTLYVARDRSRRLVSGAVAVVGSVMACGSRGDGSVYVGLVGAALVLLHWPTLRRRRSLLLIPALTSLTAVVLILGSNQFASVAAADAETDRTGLQVAVSLLLDFPTLITGMFGYGFGLGWLDTPVHSITAFGSVVVVGFLVVSGVGLGGRRKTLTLLLFAAAMLAMPLKTLYSLRMVVGESVQPRYILPLLPTLLMLAMVGRKPAGALRLRPAQAWAVVVLLSFAHSAALYINMRRYVTGLDGPLALGPVEWWWDAGPGPIAAWVAGSVGFAVFALAAVVVSRRPDQDPAGSGEIRRRSLPPVRGRPRQRERRPSTPVP